MGTTQQHHGQLYFTQPGRPGSLSAAALLSFGSTVDLVPEPRLYPDTRSQSWQAEQHPSFPPQSHLPSILLISFSSQNSYQETKCKPRIKQRVYWVSLLI